MGSGASKKTADGQEVVALVAPPGAEGSAGGASAQGSTGSAVDNQVASAAVPEKPKAPQDGKRPRPARKSKDKAGSAESLVSEESAPSGSPARRTSPASPHGRGPSPPVNGTKASEPDDDDDDDEIEEVRQPRAKPPAALSPASHAAASPAGRASASPVARAAAAPEAVASPKASAAAAAPPPAPKCDLTNEQFVAACREGNDASVQAFLAAHASTKQGLAAREEALFDSYGDSVLHHAVQSGNGKVVELLLKAGQVQVDIPNARNETALQLACRKGDIALVTRLVEAQADPDRRDASGLTPFLSAVFAGSGDEVLELLAKASADVSAQDGRGVGALHFTALRGDSSLMKWFLMCNSCPDVQTQHSTTPLMLAAKRGHTEGVALLLSYKANASLADEAGCTALMHALSAGNLEAAQNLLDSGASVDSVDCAGRTPLFHAVLGGSCEGVRAVIARGGRVNILDEEGRSPLYQACLMSEAEMAKHLLAADADPNLAGRSSTVRPAIRGAAPDGEGAAEEEDQENSAARACLDESRTCLQVCATLAHNELLTAVLERGADLNAAPGALAWTALHLCVAVNNEEGAKLLLARGALTNLEDAEGNTAEALAERAGHEGVLKLVKEAAAASPEADGSAPAAPACAAPTPSAARRNVALRGPLLGSLPPLHGSGAAAEEAPPDEEMEPLALYRDEWKPRDAEPSSLLDRVVGPMVLDAFRSDFWRLRWEALTHLSKHFSEVAGEPSELISAVAELTCIAAKDKIAKVFLASLTVFEELLSDSRVDAISPESFSALLRGPPGGQAADQSSDALAMLLDQTDIGGGSAVASSPQQVAADALCSCVLHGRVPLDEIAFPLLKRIDDRLLAEPAEKVSTDRNVKALGPKQLTANLRLLGRWLSAFGLQQSGLFRRALLMPLLMRAAASEHSKPRAAAAEAIVQMMSLSGGMEDRIWQLLPSKPRKAVQRLASEQEGVNLFAAAPCEEDAMQKDVIVSEDARASHFLCMAELTPELWAGVCGEAGAAGEGGSSAKSKSSKSRKAGSSAELGGASHADDVDVDALRRLVTSKNWKERADGVSMMAREVAVPDAEGVRVIEGSDGVDGDGRPMLSQYTIRGHCIASVQGYLGALLADAVTQVFIGAAELFKNLCAMMPDNIASVFLEPLLPPLVAKLLDTSGKVRGKAQETTLELSTMHGCALSEMIARCAAGATAWGTGPPPTAGGSAAGSGVPGAGRDSQTAPRLQLIGHVVRLLQAKDAVGVWKDSTWQACADFAVAANGHRSTEVRKEAGKLITIIGSVGGSATEIAERAAAQLQAGSSTAAASSGVPATITHETDPEVLERVVTSKNWKERAEGVAALAKELAAPGGDGVRALDGGEGAAACHGPLLSQYVLRGHQISTLQTFLGMLLADSVTQVFTGAADLLRIVCSHVPLYIAPIFLEPLLPPLVAKLLDTSGKVRGTASETTLEVASLHGCALSEMIAQCVASGSAWSSAPPPTAGVNGASSSSSTAVNADRAAARDLQTGPRLQLLGQLVKLVQTRDAIGRWTEETWRALADYAVKAARHNSGDVRKEAANLINALGAAGGTATEIAEKAVAELQAMAQAKIAKRPGTQSTRPPTMSTRLGTAAANGSRPGSNAGLLGASGRLSNLGSTGGFSLNMGSTGRLSTASRTRCGTSLRPDTSSNGRPTTGISRARDIDEESDNSLHSEAPEVEGLDGLPVGNGDAAEGVQFFDVKTACGGATEVPSVEEGEAALADALPLAEALEEVALDFVAPLIALFGEGWTRAFYSRQWQCRVAALTHLSATMAGRLEAISGPDVTPNALGELLDGAMRAVHEGLGDQNVRVYAEACLAVTAVVPAFCGAVDGRLLVAHLAPLLRQLCARMGDTKEVVRMQTVQALFRLLRPPTGNIVSPIAIAMLILRHMAPVREEGDPSPGAPKSTSAGDKAARTGWMTRIGSLRDLVKEHTKAIVLQPGVHHPGEWLRLKDGLAHSDSMVRYETARLFALVCKAHLKSLGDEEAQKPGREAWVAALPPEVPLKSIQQVRKLLKLPDDFPDDLGASGRLGASGKLGGTGRLGASGRVKIATTIVHLGRWEIPRALADWANVPIEALAALRDPVLGEEKEVVEALRLLGKAVAAFADAPKRRDGPKPDEAFGGLCRAVQQALSAPVGSDRAVFLTSVELCQLSVSQLAPVLSGLDITMGLSKTIPILMERTSLTCAGDVKVGVAADKLIQQLAKHPKVGCEAVTKMVISATSKSECPLRPLVLLRTLLSDFGLRLCAQRDVVMLLLGAVGGQLERLKAGRTNSEVAEDAEVVRPQLILVLATVNQFSPETVMQAIKEVDPEQRKLITMALHEAPNPRLVALGATAAEQEEIPHIAGSAVRAASRSRGLSPKPPSDDVEQSPPRRHSLMRGDGSGRSSRPSLPRAEDGQPIPRSSSTRNVAGDASPGGGLREASPRSGGRKHRRHRDRDAEGSPMGSAAAADCMDFGRDSSPSMSPPSHMRHGMGRASASTGSLGAVGNSLDSTGSGRSGRWPAAGGDRPPAPMGLSTRLGSNGEAGWRFAGEDGGGGSSDGRRGGGLQRVGSSEGRLVKGKESKNDSLNALMDVLSQMETTNTRGITR